MPDESEQEFTVSPRDVTAPAAATQAAVQNAVAEVESARLVVFHRDIGQAIVAVPPDELDRLKTALGPDFLVDPRAPLRLN
ncbi:MAG TPA: hypothetical protein VHB74_10805 [Devosia sp.]|nr:hypothetical protein [Devosia sp.]